MAKNKNLGAKSFETLRDSKAYASTKYCEYAVHKDKTFGTFLKKCGAILAPIIVAIGLMILLSQLLGKEGAGMIIGVVGGILFGSLSIYLIWFLLRFTEIEYEYTLADGKMEMVIIYGGRSRKPIFTQKVLDMDTIAPANGEWAEKFKEQLDESKYNKVFRYCSSMKTNDLYFCAFTHEKFGKTLCYFNGIKKSVDILKYYNGKTIVKPGIL